MSTRKAKRDPLAHKLAALAELRADPASPESVKQLRSALSDHALLVAAAAEIARDHEIEALTQALAGALARLFDAPAENDKGCRAKHALTEALMRCGHRDPELFMRGVRHVQMEPAFGGREDTGAALRAAAAMGLAHLEHPETLNELAELLTDPENTARAGAARAAAYLGDDAAIPLLRFKALSGDPDTQVLGEVFTALLRLDPRSLDFVATFLRRSGEIADAAAIALGESRLEAALDPLIAWSEGHPEVALLSIALLRSDRAFEHLLSVLERGDPRTAVHALEALATYRHDDELRRRVTECVVTRNHPKLTQTFAHKFPGT